jgi:DNA-directed RNA polymerase specialized sigma24 family protein
VPPDNDQLIELIERLAKGDRDALLELIQGLGPWLHGTITRMVSDPIAAGVLLEESFGEIWTSAPLYDDYAGDPWTWMNTVARTRAMEWRDRRRMKAKVSPATPAAPTEGTPLAELDPEDARILLAVFHDGLPGGDSGAADRARFDEALLRLADGT